MRTIILAAAVTFCFLIPSARAEKIQFQLDKEKILLETDGREWKIGSQQEVGGKGIVEYVTGDEKTDGWSERVTINYFKGMKGDDLTKRLTEFAKKGLDSQCVEVNWQNISIAPENALYEWSARKCVGAPDQSEIARAFAGKNGFYVVHYANKKVPMPIEKSEIWKKNLETLSLAEI